MIIRLSQKLNARIKAGTLPTLPLDENAYNDWSAHFFFADRTPYVLLSNTRSLYSTVMYGKGMTNDRRFINRALSNLREVMEDDGLKFVFSRFIAPACAAVRFAKATDRRVTGSMNELIQYATALLIEGERSLFDVGSRLNDVLLSALAPSRSEGYGTPRDAFKRFGEPDRGAHGG